MIKRALSGLPSLRHVQLGARPLGGGVEDSQRDAGPSSNDRQDQRGRCREEATGEAKNLLSNYHEYRVVRLVR